MAKKLQVEKGSDGGAKGLAVPVTQVALAVPGDRLAVQPHPCATVLDEVLAQGL